MAPISATSSAPAAPPIVPIKAPPKSSQTLGQTEFIRLMTTQMKMQDPMAPVDNKEMIAQMAQFSSLAGISDINTTLKGIAKQLDTVLAKPTVN